MNPPSCGLVFSMLVKFVIFNRGMSDRTTGTIWREHFLMTDGCVVFYTPRSTNIAGWKIHHLKMYFLLEKVNFHCYLCLPEGRFIDCHYKRYGPCFLIKHIPCGVFRISPIRRTVSFTKKVLLLPWSWKVQKDVRNKVAGWYGALACTTFLFFVILSSGTWNVVFVVLLKSPDVDAHVFRVAGPWLQKENWRFAIGKQRFHNWKFKKKH